MVGAVGVGAWDLGANVEQFGGVELVVACDSIKRVLGSAGTEIRELRLYGY